MILAVFGASGRTGGEILRLADARGWSVRALVRPESLFEPRPTVAAIRGSLESSEDVQAAVAGSQAVCCVFGPRSARSRPFCAEATRRIIAAMHTAGARRLLCLTGAMVGDLPANVSLPMRLMAAMFRRQCPELAADSAAQERAVMECDLDWTVVKPPRLVDGPESGPVRAAVDLRVGMLSRVSRSRLAAFMLNEIEAPRHLRERVYVRA